MGQHPSGTLDAPIISSISFSLGEWSRLWFWTAVNLLCCVIRKPVPVNSLSLIPIMLHLMLNHMY